MKLRNTATGVTVEVSEETAARLGSEFASPEPEKKAPAKKAAAKSDDK